MLRDMVHVVGARPLASVIAAAEAASPVEAVEAVTRELGRALEASEASEVSYGGHGQDRSSQRGADPALASPPRP